MSIDAYVIIGNPNSRKSSLCRSLTGAFRACVREIRDISGSEPNVYVRLSSLQESKISSSDFESEVTARKPDAVLFCLWPEANMVDPITYPDAPTYLDAFVSAGWNIKKIAVLDNASVISRWKPAYKRVAAAFPGATIDPINVTSAGIRKHFNWV